MKKIGTQFIEINVFVKTPFLENGCSKLCMTTGLLSDNLLHAT